MYVDTKEARMKMQIGQKTRYLQRKDNWLPKGRKRHLQNQIAQLGITLAEMGQFPPKVHLRDHYLFSLKDMLERDKEEKTEKLIRVAG